MPRKIAVFDLETDPFRHGRYPEPFAAGLYDGDEYWSWWGDDCCAQLVLFLSDKNWIVYAHNGGRFDHHFLLDYFNEWDKIKIINGRIASFFIGECEFRDSYNIIPVPLAAYQKDSINYDIFEIDKRDLPENRLEISKYLESDCVYLYDLVSSFVAEYGLYLTQATAAMKYWQSMSNTKAPSSDSDYYATFKQYYYGGRVECFKRGIIDYGFLSVDINSAYPYAMLSNHPISLGYFTLTPTVSDLYKNIDKWLSGFFIITAIAAGALPFRNDDGSLSFPNDSTPRIYSVTGHEILAAIDTDTIIILSVESCIIHDEFINFSDYVYHFYDKRLIAKAERDKKTDLFCKIFMNSLYGKFAANPEKYREYCIGSVESMAWAQESLGYEFAGTLGANLLLSRELDEQARYYNIATSASITGYVRAHLWRAICECDGVIYCDTDCIVAESANVPISKTLGNWEIEGRYDYGAVAGKKLYAFRYAGTDDYKTAAKGARLNASDIIRVANGETINYKSDAPSYSAFTTPSFLSRNIKML